jgi:hypothetical protein
MTLTKFIKITLNFFIDLIFGGASFANVESVEKANIYLGDENGVITGDPNRDIYTYRNK